MPSFANLGLALGLPMPRVEVIEVSDSLIEHTEDLRISLGGAKIPCRSGKQLGSLYVGCESLGMTFDYLPQELLERVLNVEDFSRVLVLEQPVGGLWTNSSGKLGKPIYLGFSRPYSRDPRNAGVG
jgi:hypothetical protein